MTKNLWSIRDSGWTMTLFSLGETAETLGIWARRWEFMVRMFCRSTCPSLFLFILRMLTRFLVCVWCVQMTSGGDLSPSCFFPKNE